MLQVHIIEDIQLVNQLDTDLIKEGFRKHNLGPKYAKKTKVQNVVKDAHKFNPIIYSPKFRIQPWALGFKKDVLSLLLVSNLATTLIEKDIQDLGPLL